MTGEPGGTSVVTRGSTRARQRQSVAPCACRRSLPDPVGPSLPASGGRWRRRRRGALALPGSPAHAHATDAPCVHKRSMSTGPTRDCAGHLPLGSHMPSRLNQQGNHTTCRMPSRVSSLLTTSQRNARHGVGKVCTRANNIEGERRDARTTTHAHTHTRTDAMTRHRRCCACPAAPTIWCAPWSGAALAAPARERATRPARPPHDVRVHSRSSI